MLVPGTRVVLALMLMASISLARGECVPEGARYIEKPACLREPASQPAHEHRVSRPNSELRVSNDTAPGSPAAGVTRPAIDNHWDAVREFGAASTAAQGAVERETPVARSISSLPWVDSNDWIRNPPQWVRDIRESRRLRAPMPVVHLWRSQQMQTLLSLGVSRAGRPGLYIARNLPY